MAGVEPDLPAKTDAPIEPRRVPDSHAGPRPTRIEDRPAAASTPGLEQASLTLAQPFRWRSLYAASMLLAVLLIGVLDYLAGPEIGSSLFLAIPVFLVAWRGGHGPGITFAALAAVAWIIGQIASGAHYTSTTAMFYNLLVRAAFFGTVEALACSKRRESLFRAAAETDFLTGLANRGGFERRLAEELEYAKRFGTVFSLAYLDCDNFKSVNDRWGHPEGNQALRTIAVVLRETLRSLDICARIGGDEFAVLLPRTPEEPARKSLERLQGVLRDTMKRQGWPLTFSIGCATFVQPVKSVEEALTMADRLMYAVKRDLKDGIRCATVPEPQSR